MVTSGLNPETIDKYRHVQVCGVYIHLILIETCLRAEHYKNKKNELIQTDGRKGDKLLYE